MQAQIVPMVEYGPKGCIEIRELDGVVEGIAYRCPHCGEEDWLPTADPRGWKWNGDRHAVSLTPSVLHRPCGYHAFLTDGVWLKQPDSP